MKKTILIFLSVLLLLSVQVAAQNLNRLKATMAFESENYSEAISYFTQALSEGETSAEMYLLRGCAYYHSGQLNDAKSDFEQAERLKRGMAALWLAKVAAKENNTTEALRYLRAHLSSSAYRLPENKIVTVPAFEQLKTTTGWRELWQTSWYNAYEEQLAEAEFQFENQRFREANTLLTNLLEGSSSRPDAYALRAKVLEQQQLQKQAIGDWTTAIELRRNNPAYYMQRARLYTETGKLRQAASDYNTALQMNAYIPDAYLLRADVLIQLGQNQEAAASLETYRQCLSENTSAEFLNGKIAVAQRNYLDAMRYFSLAIENDASKPHYFTARASVYAHTGALKFAIDDYSMALDLTPYDGEIYFQRGLLYLQNGNQRQACFDFEKAYHYGYEAAQNYLNACGN